MQNGHLDVTSSDHASSSSKIPQEANGLSPDDLELFDSSLLQKLDFSTALSDYHGAQVSPRSPGGGLTMRALKRGDFDRGALFVVFLFFVLLIFFSNLLCVD